ncbi:Fic family protein [Gynurincola endophyticus]|uniref:Fic family protein n=1 Tax=Gynurincola endophyticus TaxID=2479004 RepID=UPI000F8EF3A5|nr:Fic family protein [Gynurincola endophyticus]
MRLPAKPPFVAKGFIYSDGLDELIQLGRFSEFLDVSDRKYYYWDKWKYLALEWGIDPKLLWYTVKTHRLSNRRIQISAIDGFTFRLGNPSVVQEFLHQFDLNLGGTIQGESIIPAEERDKYLISSLMEEAIASSQIEGAATTRKVAKEMLEKNRKPRNTSEQMILNNYEAMKWIVKNKELPFSVENIKHIHGILTRSTLSDAEDEGHFRTGNDISVVDVQTGNSVYVPPDFNNLNQLMCDFCNWANSNEKNSFFVHPITKGVILHFLIGYIHPFVDGNGRTARTIFYWFLIKKGYWLIEYMSVSRIILNSKAQYARAYLYTEQDENDLTYFLLYNLRAIRIALEDLKKYIQRKTEEKRNLLVLLRHTNFNDRQIAILQNLIHDQNTYFTVKQIQTMFGVSNQTARNDLSGLVEKELLEERKNGLKSQFLPVGDFLTKLLKKKF